jgi:hypothetical protein
MLGPTPSEPELHEACVELCILGTRSLTQSVKSFVKLQYHLLKPFPCEPGWLSDIHLFIEIPVQEGRLHIHLVHRPAMVRRHGQN